jgi:hypothetical protein
VQRRAENYTLVDRKIIDSEYHLNLQGKCFASTFDAGYGTLKARRRIISIFFPLTPGSLLSILPTT